MLTAPEHAALSYRLIDGVDSRVAASAAQLPQERLDALLTDVAPAVRGCSVNFNRYLEGKTPLERDGLRLDYEIRLVRLQMQHDLCIDAWRRSDRHALEQFSQAPSNEGAASVKPKTATGDIRFLQLARNIRRELDQVEKLLKERIEELQQTQSEPESTKQPSTAPATAPSSVQRSELPLLQKPATNQVNPPLQIPAPAAARRIPRAKDSPILQDRNSLLAELTSSKTIPEIPPPPRKPDKYAGK